MKPFLSLRVICLFAAIPLSVFAQSVDKGWHRGTVSVRIANIAHQESETYVFLEDEHDHEHYHLGGEEWLSHVETGDRISVRGTKRGWDPRANARGLHVEQFLLEAPGNGKGGGSAGGGGGGKPDGGGIRLGNRSVAIVLIDLLDGDPLMTREEAETLMWAPEDSVNDFFQRDSRGKLSFPSDSNRDGQADVFGPYALQDNGAGSRSYSTWSRGATTLASQDGVNLDQYDHRIFVLTDNNSISWGGLAELNGDDIWINYPADFVFAHELGHNLGVHHAGSDRDNDTRIESSYGDQAGVMGCCNFVYLNAPHKEALGFLPASAYVTAPTQVGSSEYTIYPLAAENPAGPQVVKLARLDDEATYYFSFRDDTGYDGNIRAADRGGLGIRWSRQAASVSAHVTTLSTGETWLDRPNGIAITQLEKAVDDSSVTFRITQLYTEPVGRPEISVVSDSGASGAKENVVQSGEPSMYTINVQNTDTIGLDPTTFGFQFSRLPAGLTATLEPTTLLLGAGESGSARLRIDTVDGAEGLHVFHLDVLDIDGVERHHLSDMDWGRVRIDNSPAPLPPETLRGEMVSAKRNRFYASLRWEASPSDDVAGYNVYTGSLDNPVLLRSTSALTSNIYVELGTHNFFVAARNNAGRISSFSNLITLTARKGK